MTVILASSSKFRKQLLSKLRIPFKSISPDIDESRLKNESVSSYVKRLSIEKARKVGVSCRNSIIIGSDEVADLDGTILGKPITKEKAKKQLKMLSGNKVVFRTGLCVLNSKTNKYYASVNNYTIYFNNLTNNTINSYLSKDDVLKCAASIRIEGLAINLVKKMNGKDPSSIMGLPLIKLIDYLDKFNISVMTK
ncbi:Maf family protein [Gammaproteobacteria bacterium]|nr:Maf family protein [Gammaproteobacteria bacterium]